MNISVSKIIRKLQDKHDLSGVPISDIKPLIEAILNIVNVELIKEKGISIKER